jgi:hypothetical protein
MRVGFGIGKLRPPLVAKDYRIDKRPHVEDVLWTRCLSCGHQSWSFQGGGLFFEDAGAREMGASYMVCTHCKFKREVRGT